MAVTNKKGDTPLVCVARNGQAAVVRALLAAGAARGHAMLQDNHRPLIAAAEEGHTAVVDALLAAETTAPTAPDGCADPMVASCCVCADPFWL